jgi:NADP+-dependent farnesol dehydrogenase
VLINNAGIIPQTSLTSANSSDNVRLVIDTNVMGLVHCTREAVRSMRERCTEGHVIHINSIAGHYMSFHRDSTAMGIYYASKYAVTALAEQHRHEFIKEKLNIKVTVSCRVWMTGVCLTSAAPCSR